METKPYSRLISPTEISKESPYGLRFHYRDDSLEVSLKKRGILFPLLLTSSKRQEKLTVVSGHKRLLTSRHLGFKEVPVIMIEEELNPKELFVLSLYSNWGHQFTELDRMTSLEKAGNDFGFTAQEIKEEMVPLLGIPAHQAEEYEKISGLANEIHLLIDQKKIPFHGAGGLARFSSMEQIFLAQNLFENLHLTSNQLMQISEWLGDLQKSKKLEIPKILAEESLSTVLHHAKMDARTRGERFFETLWAERFPRLSKKERDFQKLKAKLEDQEIKLERPEGFEAQGLILRARLKKRGLAATLKYLENNQAHLENFLEGE